MVYTPPKLIHPQSGYFQNLLLECKHVVNIVSYQWVIPPRTSVTPWLPGRGTLWPWATSRFRRLPNSWKYWDVCLLTKYQDKIEFFWGVPPFWPLKKWSLPKMTTIISMTPNFCIAENGGVSKKLDLDILKIDKAIGILGSNKNFRIFLLNEKFSHWGKLV